MQWAINSGRPATAAELEKVLREDVESHLRGRRKVFAQNVLDDVQPQGPEPVDAEVARQMEAGIKAAVSIAQALGDEDALFLASVSGHVDPDHSDGIEERMSVFVDRAKPAKEQA